MFVIIAICQNAPFCHLFVDFCQTFDNFLPNSPSSQNLSLSWKSPTINMPLFVISFEYLAKPLMNFWHTHHICRNLSFVNIPLFVTSFEVLTRSWVDSCSVPHFPTFAIFVKNANCQYDCLVLSLFQSLPNSPVRFGKFVIFVKSPFVKMPLFVISFEYLAKPLMNFWDTRHFVEICLFLLNLPFSYYNRYLSRFPSLSLQLRFCQTFNGFLPNSPFS